MRRRWTVAIVALALFGLACENPGGGALPGDPDPSPVKGFPSSMVALGDSLTAAFGSCLAPTGCPRNSWATGDGLQVYSHYRRILASNPAIKGHARNVARSGAVAADLPGQAAVASRTKTEYITVLIGANDACAGVAMTPIADFRADVDEALATLKAAMPKARVVLVSIPNIYRVWEVGHTNQVALAAWRAGSCPQLLTNPTSTAPVDVGRREAFRKRVADYNAQLKAACAAYGSKCRFDNIADFAFSFTMLSALDFFHPNAAGQSELAKQTYPGTFTW